MMRNFIPSGSGGILMALSPAWYVGLALVIAGVVVGLVASGWAAGAAVAALQLTLTLTPAIVYSLPRYSWTFKHLGVVEYILKHGSVNPTVDLYQSWPALFAGVAWVCHCLGIHNPTPIARWWPPVIDLAVVFAVQRLALRVLGNVRRSWVAAAIVVVGNMIGQDYFSPQSAGFLLAVAVFAAVYKRREERRGMDAIDWVVASGMVVAVVATHQLSPYMITGATLVLVLFGFCRSRLVPAATFALAAGWALLHLDTVRRYLNLGQLGHITTNLLTKGLSSSGIHKSALIRLNSYAMATDAALIGIMALLVLLQRRDKLHLALALCAASGAGIFIANSYGNEGAFRVVLFALPWLAVLSSDWDAARAPRMYWAPVVSLPILLATYLLADWGLDYMNVMRQGDLSAEQVFETSAPAGSHLIILGGGHVPVKSTSRYDLFKFRTYSNIAPEQPPGSHSDRYSAAISFDNFMVSAIPNDARMLQHTAYYVMSSSASDATAQELHQSTAPQYASFTRQFLHSNDWQLITHTPTSDLFRLVSFVGDKIRPTITGFTKDGGVLTANRGFWVSLNPLRYSYQWELCDPTGKNCAAIAGATHNSVELHAPDIGHRVTVVVRASDTKGRSREVAATMTSVVGIPTPPVAVAPPTLVGTPAKGQRISVRVGSWESPDKLHFHYQWEACATSSSSCTPIPGRTKANLIIRNGYLGRYITVVVTAVDQENQSTQASAKPVGPAVP